MTELEPGPMPAQPSVHRIFLLSPANLSGVRAGYLTRKNGASDLAQRLRSTGAPLGELFSFMSGLYFRGKLAYAKAFAAPPPDVSGSFVITSSAGLVSPDTVVTLDWLCGLSPNGVDVGEPRYRQPLDRDSRKLLAMAGPDCEVVLLGSIATSKYVEPLTEVFGSRLLFPAEFVGRGDMSRGGLMLRCVQERKSLTYIPVASAVRRGSRPPKLEPMRRSKAAG
ncbi:MAG TPA: hypothetical protein VJQ82_10850 [Terriglobales bacterium]|nr:hypothetical protein [Terriglobales bacterium]